MQRLSVKTCGRSWRSDTREGAKEEREADRAERQRSRMRGEAENEELNSGRRMESGRKAEI